MITQARLKELLSYDKNTGLFTWNKQYVGRERKGKSFGVNTQGYVQVRLDKCVYLAHRLAWLYVNGYFPEHDIDHINRSRKDNSICNLREATRSCNMRNTGNKRDNTSGVKGVDFVKRRNVWRARITINGIAVQVGSSSDFTEAVALRLSAEQCINWSSCDKCSPACLYIKKWVNKCLMLASV